MPSMWHSIPRKARLNAKFKNKIKTCITVTYNIIFVIREKAVRSIDIKILKQSVLISVLELAFYDTTCTQKVGFHGTVEQQRKSRPR